MVNQYEARQREREKEEGTKRLMRSMRWKLKNKHKTEQVATWPVKEVKLRLKQIKTKCQGRKSGEIGKTMNNLGKRKNKRRPK